MEKITEYCGEESAKDTLDLINRQKAEIERLQKEVEHFQRKRTYGKQ